MNKPKPDFKEACRLYLLGKSLEEVADTVGSEKSTVRRAIIARGVQMRRRGRPKPEQYTGG